MRFKHHCKAKGIKIFNMDFKTSVKNHCAFGVMGTSPDDHQISKQRIKPN